MHTKDLKHYPYSIKSVAFSSNNKLLASSSDRNEIFTWDVEMGKQLRCFNFYCQPNNSIIFSPDGNWLAYGSDKGEIFMFDLAKHPASVHPGKSPEGYTL